MVAIASINEFSSSEYVPLMSMRVILRSEFATVRNVLPRQGSDVHIYLVSTLQLAGCAPAEAVMCDEGVCSPGKSGYTCGKCSS